MPVYLDFIIFYTEVKGKYCFTAPLFINPLIKNAKPKSKNVNMNLYMIGDF